MVRAGTTEITSSGNSSNKLRTFFISQSMREIIGRYTKANTQVNTIPTNTSVTLKFVVENRARDVCASASRIADTALQR